MDNDDVNIAESPSSVLKQLNEDEEKDRI